MKGINMNTENTTNKETKKNANPKFFGFIALSISLITFSISGFILFNTITFNKNSISTEGTVVDYFEKRTSKGYMARLTIVFTDNNNKEVEFKTNYSSEYTYYTEGETVYVSYLKDDSSKAKEGSNQEIKWFPIIITGGLGIGFMFFAIIFLVYAPYEEKQYLLEQQKKENTPEENS
jgi:hypothetical protein